VHLQNFIRFYPFCYPAIVIASAVPKHILEIHTIYLNTQVIKHQNTYIYTPRIRFPVLILTKVIMHKKPEQNILHSSAKYFALVRFIDNYSLILDV